ncbi:hypothetical protein ACQUWM_15005 [Marinobacter sp. DUT-3]|uniref:hypothetical protein n=1 Tax=Marinobacter sp. DUT-3 TaxID=3412036 RepID=UPI003D172BB0
MSYRLTDVTELPRSPDALLTIVHPLSAVDIVSRILSPYTTASDPIENLDSRQRKDDLLDQLAVGERLLLDASGASPGIFRSRRAEADFLVSNLSPRLTRALNDHLDGKNVGGGAPAPLKSDSLAPAIEPGYQPPAPVPKASPKRGARVLDLLYQWPDGTGVAGAPYSVEGLDSYQSGNLDNEGKARVTGLSDPVVNVRFGKPAPAGELDILRRQLQAGLDAILTRERREAERLDASTDSLPLNIKAGVHFAHGFLGLWDSAVGLIANSLAIANLTHVGYYNRALQSAWAATRDSSDQAWLDAFKQNFDETNKQALVEALGFDPDAITKEQLVEAYEATNLILADSESRGMLGQFAVDFAQAQDSTEISYFAGGLVFETVLAIMLASAGGAGVASAAPRYLRKLAPLGESLRNLAARLKISYQTRYHYNVDTGGLCESTCRTKPEGADLKPRDLSSRRLNISSVEEALAALAASRRRIIARGGFTPKYTQEELAYLATQGLDKDRFIVRLVEERHVDGHNQPEGAMAGTLGRASPAGEVRFWSTTLDQIEPSDTCPRLIAQQLGVEYNPEATYKLAIIDKDKAVEMADAETIIPTFKNLTDFMNTKLPNKPSNPEMVREVMTPEYQARYEKLVEGMGDAEWDDPDLRRDYLADIGLNTQEIQKFETRLKIQMNTGANEHFQGNGLTKHTALSKDGKVVYGALETYTVEKSPQTFYTMTNGGNGGPKAYVELVDLTPLEFGE